MKLNKKFSMAIIVVVCITILSSCTSENEKLQDYFKVDYQLGTTFKNQYEELFSENIKVISSIEEIAALNMDHSDYTDKFFLHKSLIVLKFTHPSTEKNIEFYDLVTNEGKLYFIFQFDSQEINTDDLLYSSYLIEISNDIINDYAIGEILVINNTDPKLGSVHFDKFLGKIKRN